jgi:hypothetical protein
MATPSRGFLRLPHDLIRSERFALLSANAVKLVIHMAAFHNGRNNGSIRYGVAQAMVLLGCSKPTACKCFAELRDAGLIEPTERASFYNKDGARHGKATAWRLTFVTNRVRT